MISTGLAESSAKKYEGAAFGAISNWALENKIIEYNLAQIEDLEELDSFISKIKKLSIFQERDETGRRMYSNALKRYREYLNEQQFEIDNDIKSLKNDSHITVTEKERLINSRLGQGDFRNDLFDIWNGCSVTGYRLPKLLIASHIKPWRNSDNSERLDPLNGFLLIPNLDKAFDKGFISFKNNGMIILSELLLEPEKLGIVKDMKVETLPEHGNYLEYHRDMVFVNT